MELTFDDKLDLVFGTIPDAPIIEAAEVDDDEDLGLDRRLGVTTAWKHYRSDLQVIQQIRDQTKRLGLDQEFKQIASAAIDRDIDSVSSSSPLNFAEARSIVWAIYHSGLREKIDDSKKGESRRIPAKDVPSDVSSAIKLLSKEAKTHHGGKRLTVMHLVDTREVGSAAQIKFRYDIPEGGTRSVSFDNSTPLHEQFKKLVVILHSLKHNDMLDKLKKTFAARSQILEFYWPDRSESQRKYTAAFYTLRNIADELSAVEARARSK